MIGQFREYLAFSLGRAERTAAAYARILGRLEAFLASCDRQLASATSSDLEAFVGLELHAQGVSARSRRPHVAAIRKFYEWASKRGLIASNPAEELVYPTSGRALPNVMQAKQLEALLLSIPLDEFLGIRDATIISVLAGVGLRVSGLTALNERDLVSETGERGREVWSLRVREKGGHQRLMPVPDEAAVLLRAYLVHPELKAIDRVLANGDQVLFVSTANRQVPAWRYTGEHRRLSTYAVWRMLRRRGHAAGIPQTALHPHALRHLYATELAEADVDQLTIAELMGHRDPKSTAIYVHLAQSRLRKIVDRANPLASISSPGGELARTLRRRFGP